MREPLTSECIAIYIETLADLTDDQLKIAVRRAINELEWFPKPAKLRELAGWTPEVEQNTEAEEAWNFAIKYLHHWGVDRLPCYSQGRRIEAPGLPARVEHALRAIGGLWALNQITNESLPFRKKAFIEAYLQAPTAERLAPRLSDLFGERKLLGEPKLLMAPAPQQEAAPEQARRPKQEPAQNPRRTPYGMPLTDAQRRDRRELLQRQASELLHKRGTMMQECGK